MKILFLVCFLWMIAAFSQTIEQPNIQTDGESQAQVMEKAIEKCLIHLFPSQKTPAQHLLWKEILQKATDFFLKKKITQDKGKVQGMFLVDIPKILDAILAAEMVQKDLKGHSLSFICEDKIPDEQGFLAHCGFSVRPLTSQEKEELISLKKSKSWRKPFSDFLAARKIHFLIEWNFSRQKETIEAYNVTGRLISHFSSDFAQNSLLLPFYSQEKLLLYHLVQDIAMNTLKWQVAKEYVLILENFPLESRKEITSILQETKGIEEISYFLEDAQRIEYDIQLCQIPNTLESLHKQLSLRCANIFTYISRNASSHTLTFQYCFSWGWLWLMLLTGIIAAMLRATLKIKKESEKKMPEKNYHKPQEPIIDIFEDETNVPEVREEKKDIDLQDAKISADNVNIGRGNQSGKGSSGTPSPYRSKIQARKAVITGKNINIGDNNSIQE